VKSLTPGQAVAAQYLAYALPCERFTSALADTRAGAVRYSFTATDSTVYLLPVSRRTCPQHHEPTSALVDNIRLGTRSCHDLGFRRVQA
jgi:hypothetical protein